MEQFICIGVVLKPFGIKGEVKVKSLTDFEKQRFKIGKSVKLVSKGLVTEKVIVSVRHHQDALLIRFEGIDSMDDAEKIRDHEIMIDRSTVHKLPENEYYFFDLKECEVFTESGESLGIVDVVEDYPAHPVLRIKKPGKDLLIPFVGRFLADVDIKAKKIVVRNLEGLI